MSEHEPTPPVPPGDAPSGLDDVPTASVGDRAVPEPTTGTGSFFAIGCVILLVVGVIVLGALFLGS